MYYAASKKQNKKKVICKPWEIYIYHHPDTERLLLMFFHLHLLDQNHRYSVMEWNIYVLSFLEKIDYNQVFRKVCVMLK